MSHRLIQIDDLNRPDHSYLTSQDRCFYVMEYTSGKDYRYSKVNSLIKNFKKELDRKHLPEWVYKGRAINEIASIFKDILAEESLNGITIVPVPSSKSKDDDLYDDRLIKVLEKITEDFEADIREIIYLEETIEASHNSEDRPTPDELEEVYGVDEELCEGPPTKIIVFDDMITAGSHFRACKNILKRRFPDAEIIGVFITRRVLLNVEPEE